MVTDGSDGLFGAVDKEGGSGSVLGMVCRLVGGAGDGGGVVCVVMRGKFT